MKCSVRNEKSNVSLRIDSETDSVQRDEGVAIVTYFPGKDVKAW